ncbi:MAG: glycine cleavage system protein GcvH [Methylococcales bacterium]|nr:glycine cleavage system protein GcvH [Methylococcales bacterium]
MSDIPNDLHYAKTHEWIKLESDNIARVGISDFAQSQLGDLVYVELPSIGDKVDTSHSCAVVESVKAASDLFAPVSGIITAVNTDLTDSPELVNDEPYESWIFCLKIDDLEALKTLMSANDYQTLTNDS